MQARMPYEGGFPMNQGVRPEGMMSNRPAGMTPPGPRPGSTFAGGSFSPRRRALPTSTNTSPPMPQATPDMMGQRMGWNGAALPPGQMRQLQMGHSLNPHWAPIAQAAGLMPAAPAAQPALQHQMPDGSMMPGATHPAMPSLPQQARGPRPMPPGQARKPGKGRRVMRGRR